MYFTDHSSSVPLQYPVYEIHSYISYTMAQPYKNCITLTHLNIILSPHSSGFPGFIFFCKGLLMIYLTSSSLLELQPCVGLRLLHRFLSRLGLPGLLVPSGLEKVRFLHEDASLALLRCPNHLSCPSLGLHYFRSLM